MPALIQNIQNEVESELLHLHRKAHNNRSVKNKRPAAKQQQQVLTKGALSLEIVPTAQTARHVSDDDDDLCAWSVADLDDELPNSLATEMERVYLEMAHHRKAITQTMSSLRKCQKKIQNAAQRKKGQKRRKGGLLKPCSISDHLRDFMELPQGTRIARAEVTKFIHRYIKTNNLYDSTNRQFIVPNTRLSELLNVSDGEKLHMFSIPEKMNPHFLYDTDTVKTAATAETTATATAVTTTTVEATQT